MAEAAKHEEVSGILLSLSIRNLALIDGLDLEFGPGLNVLTGETGAGKSIVISAVAAALGGRASAELVRAGEDAALVEAVFSIEGRPQIEARLAEFGLEGDPGVLWLGREIARSGRNKARVNGRVVPAQLLAELGAHLVDIHGQHDHQSLLRPESHLALLDACGGQEQRHLVERVGTLWHAWSQAAAALRQIEAAAKEHARREDLLRFQVEEIERASLSPGEWAALQAERQTLLHADRLEEEVGAAYRSLYEAEPPERSAVDALGEAVQAVRGALRHDPRLEEVIALLEGALNQAQEAAHDLRRYREDLRHDPARLAEVEQRILTIDRLQRKYGDDEAAIIAFRDQARRELEELAQSDERAASLAAECRKAAAAYHAAAALLSHERRETARSLSERVGELLAELGMPDATFSVAFEPLSATAGEDEGAAVASGPELLGGRAGLERAEFLLTANRGEGERPLARTASGGELSRVMLALRQVLSDTTPTLIFDEIDTGIGGRTAMTVAERLARLSGRHQILCVTHLAQIAASAAHHFAIEKEIQDERTRIRVRRLTLEERIAELARMLGGTRTTITLQHAREMIAQAAQWQPAHGSPSGSSA